MSHWLRWVIYNVECVLSSIWPENSGQLKSAINSIERELNILERIQKIRVVEICMLHEHDCIKGS